MGLNPVTFTQTSDIAPISSKKFLDIHSTLEHRFTLKHLLWLCGWVFLYELISRGSNLVTVTWISGIAHVSSKELLDIQATIECRRTLKCIRDMMITYSQMNLLDKYSQHSPFTWSVWLNGWVFSYQLSIRGSITVTVTLTSDISHVLSKKCLDIQTSMEWRRTLKRIRYIIIKYSQLNPVDKHSQQISFIWSVWLNGLVLVFEHSGRGFGSRSCHLNVRYHIYFKEGLHWHSGNYRVYIHSETSTWWDSNMEWNASHL